MCHADDVKRMGKGDSGSPLMVKDKTNRLMNVAVMSYAARGRYLSIPPFVFSKINKQVMQWLMSAAVDDDGTPMIRSTRGCE